MSDIKLIEVNDTSLDADNNDARLVKSLGVGPDVQTPTLVGPYGTDSNPIKGVIGVQGDTQVNGDAVILGFINTDNKAAIGEHRTFSTNADGNLKSEIWQRANGDVIISNPNGSITLFRTGRIRAENASGYIDLLTDGTIELDGNADNAVRYSALETAYNQLKSDHDDVVTDNNNLKTAFSAFQAALITAGGTPLTGTSLGGIVATAFATYYGQPLMPSTGDVTPAKIDEVKTT